ncbi:UDP-N-acetylmuramate--L-alanine ligase [Muricauda sp. SCSIO 64092]|uniref:UDP-N-acetylmuramate--L-alanine ligase n=1 Tax=Allomuricauda sp. SCSIO 64092 TaxID=2908842 RepID=UPI001FF697DA|nr:UDP-N-acetylmuramate--L-alanine ligase [Muricauda sp. SCSIO 64092]UOY07580.1 UDP-N-acetylmuramate--L-alanine ligase [Muricauda sp. SCSIO 64092]
MKVRDIHSVYFIGIGGIGMSALARYFLYIGKEVAGYDKTATPLTGELENLGIAVHYEDSVVHISEEFTKAGSTLVVYTPAVPNTHSELCYFRGNGFEVKKRSEVLGLITKDTFCFAVAGTHGKTTTSCILAHLLKEVDSSFTAFLGGISEDFNSNFVFEGNTYSVVEADEFDRSFLQLSPNVACVTSMDADHLDIYGTVSDLIGAFEEFAKKLGATGKLLVKKGLPLQGITYGIEDGADYCVKNIRIQKGVYLFDIHTPSGTLQEVMFQKPGRHNLLNALAAFAMAVEAGFPAEPLARGLQSFKGVQRRFSYQIKEKDFVFIDDYAHHPAEIEAVYDAVSEMHPNLFMTVVFQPHLFSRTKDFVDGFATSLAKFDKIFLLDIYPAREKPIPGVTSDWLLKKIDNPNKKLVEKAGLLMEIQNDRPDVLITLGAGDIGLEVPKIKKALAYAS